MDYKEQVALIRGLAYEWNKCSHITKIGGMKLEEFLLLTATVITDLLARAEAAEARCKLAEKCFDDSALHACETQLELEKKARAEAEARAEKAERERDDFKAKYIEAVKRACELSKIVDDHGWEE